jgi:hypothetical protein
MKKQKRAYILSTIHGTIQIGRTVYSVSTGKKFTASMKGLKKYPYVLVNRNSFEEARKALQLYGSIEKSRNLTIQV